MAVSVTVLAVAAVVCLLIQPLAGILIIATLAAFVLANLFLAVRMRGMQKRDQYTHSMYPLLGETLSSFNRPVAIISADNTLAWYNVVFGELQEAHGVRLGAQLNDQFGGMLSYSALKRAFESDDDRINLSLSSGEFSVEAVPCTYMSKKFFAAIFHDRSEYTALANEFGNSKWHIAAISFDNSNEIKEVHDNYREIAGKIALLLADWADSIDGILTENENGKYMLAFTHDHLAEMVDSRFDILDKVAAASRDSILPLTVSIGISSCDGTPKEKYTSANAALSLAYQKGGAIAVLIGEDGKNLEFGGRTKPVQSQSPTRSRICKDMLKHHVSISSNVLIFGHERPDYDSIASCIGIACFVREVGGSAKIIVDTEYDGIRPVLDFISGDRNFDDLFVSRTYGQELLGPDTLLIVTDVSNPDKFESPEIYHNANRVIIIDHHAKSGDLDNNVAHLYIDPSASSASEMVAEICEFEIKQTYLGANVADLLLTGIMLDTDRLMKETGARTFSACRYLSKEGAETWRALQFFKNSADENRVITNTVSTMTVYRDSFALATINDLEGSYTVTAAKTANSMLAIEGITASFVLYFNNGRVNISARSDHTVNVKNIVAALGGGGHFQAAGGVVTVFHDDGSPSYVKDMTNATDLLKKEIDRYMDSLGES